MGCLFVVAGIVEDRWTAARTAGASVEVRIGPEGALVQDRYYSWNQIGIRIEHVRIEREEGLHLLIRMTVFGLRPPGGGSLRVPIPEGKEHEAENVATKLRSLP